MGLGIDLYAKKKDGHVFPVEISLGHYLINDEMLAVAFVTDITGRKEMEKELKKKNEELEMKVRERTLELTDALEREKELNEMKSRFVSMASHEFRTPLSAVLSSVSLIESYHADEQKEKRVKHVERIKSSVKNLTDILNDFLSLDKLEQGKVEAEVSAFNLEEFLEDIVEEMDGMARKKQLRINYAHNGALGIMQDKKILRNVMLNLISNAVKYSLEEKEIYITSDIDQDIITISVKDNGIGIPEEEQKHLFNKFFRAKNASDIQGTGLGLNIVKKYVELLDGVIYFSSGVNKGTTFTIEFPQNKP
jgi:signal transduction histidine kinase